MPQRKNTIHYVIIGVLALCYFILMASLNTHRTRQSTDARFNACVSHGGSWVPGRDNFPMCINGGQ